MKKIISNILKALMVLIGIIMGVVPLVYVFSTHLPLLTSIAICGCSGIFLYALAVTVSEEWLTLRVRNKIKVQIQEYRRMNRVFKILSKLKDTGAIHFLTNTRDIPTLKRENSVDYYCIHKKIDPKILWEAVDEKLLRVNFVGTRRPIHVHIGLTSEGYKFVSKQRKKRTIRNILLVVILYAVLQFIIILIR